MAILKSDAKFTEPFFGTTEVIVMMAVKGGKATSSAVRLDYNAVHALEKAIVDYTFVDETPQTVQKIAEFQKMCGIEIDPDRMNTDCGWK